MLLGEIPKINKKIAEIANEIEVKFLDRLELACDLKKKKCRGITEDGYKIYVDSAHLTVNGAKYFSEQINELNWFELRKN